MILPLFICSVKMSVWELGRDTDIEQKRGKIDFLRVGPGKLVELFLPAKLGLWGKSHSLGRNQLNISWQDSLPVRLWLSSRCSLLPPNGHPCRKGKKGFLSRWPNCFPAVSFFHKSTRSKKKPEAILSYPYRFRESGISVFHSDLTEIFFGLQECVYDLWIKVRPLFFRDDLNGLLMRERSFVNPVAGQGIIRIG